MPENRETILGFTTDFHYQSGKPFFSGFALETKVSRDIDALYRVLVKHPENGNFYTMKGMEDPMTQDEINDVLEKKYRGSIMADEFAFEVFDSNRNRIYATRFDASSKIPTGSGGEDSITFTSFSWSFDLPENLKSLVVLDEVEHD